MLLAHLIVIQTTSELKGRARELLEGRRPPAALAAVARVQRVPAAGAARLEVRERLRGATDRLASPTRMFAWASSFNQPLNKWNAFVEGARMCYMFYEAKSFNQPLHAPWYDSSSDEESESE